MSCNKTLFESNTRAAACSKLAYYSVPTPWKELGSEKLVCWKELGIYVVEATKEPFIQMSHLRSPGFFSRLICCVIALYVVVVCFLFF